MSEQQVLHHCDVIPLPGDSKGAATNVDDGRHDAEVKQHTINRHIQCHFYIASAVHICALRAEHINSGIWMLTCHRKRYLFVAKNINPLLTIWVKNILSADT